MTMFDSESATGITRHLVCLDLVRGGTSPTPEEDARIGRCRRLLAYARASGWVVSHVYPRTTSRSARPLEGLAPLPSEPVYYRAGASAFSNRVFCRAIKEHYQTELVIMTLSLSSTALGTALSAHDRELPVTLIGDTLKGDEAEVSGLEAIQTVAHALVAPFVQIRAVGELIDQRRGLRLVEA
jgi:hypothetical protein